MNDFRVDSNQRYLRLAIRTAANAAILLLWLWLFRPVYAYLSIIFTRQEFRTNQIALLAVFALVVVQMKRGRLRLSPLDLPQLHLPALLLALVGSAAFIAAERWLDINTLSATLFGLATYGLLGLWMEPHRWRQGLPAALLIIGVLPFGEHMETFIGYPLRLVTARIVGSGLSALGVQNLGVDTILVFENGLSQVDSPCSGVKSLWTGGMFLLAATWLERRPINRRWLITAIVLTVLLLASNLLRVMTLVTVGQVLGWGLLAEMLHVPLGVIGFAAACAGALGMLRWVGESPAHPQEVAAFRLPRPGWLAPALGITLLVLALLYAPRPQLASAAGAEVAISDLHFPKGLAVVEWPLTSGEYDWLSANGSLPVSAARWRFEWQGLSGSLLFIASDTWRAQHRPERCFTVYGLEVQDSIPYFAGQGFTLRWLTLGKAHDESALYTAGYWLQSIEKATDDYSIRIWDDMAPQPQPWVLVTVLFDKPVDRDSQAALDLFTTLRSSLQSSLEAAEQ